MTNGGILVHLRIGLPAASGARRQTREANGQLLDGEAGQPTVTCPNKK